MLVSQLYIYPELAEARKQVEDLQESETDLRQKLDSSGPNDDVSLWFNVFLFELISSIISC